MEGSQSEVWSPGSVGTDSSAGDTRADLEASVLGLVCVDWHHESWFPWSGLSRTQHRVPPVTVLQEHRAYVKPV